MNRDFFDFTDENGIYLRPSPSYCHELNGVAERFNRTVMDTARCLMADSNLHKRFWPECVKTATYLRNRTIGANDFNKTPYEIFIGKKPDVSNLRIFGSIGCVRTPEERRNKLDPKSMKGVLVGYTNLCYRMLIEDKIVES